MSQIVKDVISILEDFIAGKITNNEGLKKLDELQKANRYNFLSGVAGSAEQVLLFPDPIESIERLIKQLKGENGTCGISHGWLRLDENRLNDNEKKVLEVARAYVSRLEDENYQRPRESLSAEERKILNKAAWDSKTFPLISGIAQNLLPLSKNKEQVKYEIDFIIKNVKRFDENEFISYKIIQQGQIYMVCIM